MQGILHYMIDLVNPDEDYSVGDFERAVNAILNENCQNTEKNVIIAGGTGLYIKSITDGFAQLPSKDEKIRADLESRNIEELQEMLKRLDKKSYDEIDLSNKLRLVRAIEVCLLTGRKFSELRVQNVKNNNYEFMSVLTSEWTL